MKTNFCYAFILALAAVLLSCKKEFPADPPGVKDLTVSGCKTKGETFKGDEPEYITFKTVNDFYLLVNHINSMFNCEPGEIIVSLEITGNTITIDENESTSLVNCICPFDVEFKLGPLEYGDYTLIFQKGGWTFKKYSLDFKKSTDDRVDI